MTTATKKQRRENPLKRPLNPNRGKTVKVDGKERRITTMYKALFPEASSRMWAIRSGLGFKSQKAMAEECGLSASAIGRIEAGYGLPLGRTLIKLAQVGVSANFILGISDTREIV